MTDHPMLFSAAMVRALLEGRKTQTRRLLKPQPDFAWGETLREQLAGSVALKAEAAVKGETEQEALGRFVGSADAALQQIVRYAPGDHIWVRETHWRLGHWERRYDAERKKRRWLFIPANEAAASISFDEPAKAYQGTNRADPQNRWWKRPSLFMSRKLSRLTLTVTDVRVQRVQEISEADARAEGIPETETVRGHQVWHASNRASYRALWDSLNAKRAPWASNPWVVALTFSVEQRNIDA